MGGRRAAEVVIVSLGSTAGLRAADEELEASLARAGASVALASAPAPARSTRTMMLTDLAWARAARSAGRDLLRRLDARPRAAVIYSSTTAALLWPQPGAIRFDAPSAGNRPGRHGLWQRPLERRRLRQASLLLPWSSGALAELPPAAREQQPALVLPVPVEPSGPGAPGEQEIAAITYAANPSKKGVDRVLSAWRRVRRERSWQAQRGSRVNRGSAAGEELVIVGASASELRRAGVQLVDRDGREDGVRVVGPLPAHEYRALVRRARVFVCAPRREDYGIAQLEALADGCLLVSTPSPGPYAALPIARELDPRLVSEDLAAALRAALDDPAPGYAERARRALAPFSRAAADRVVAEQLLPRLLG